MKKFLLILLILLLIFVSALIIAQYNSDREEAKEPTESIEESVEVEAEKIVTETGATAPGFELKDRNGEILSLYDLKGKAVLLFFWTST